MDISSRSTLIFIIGSVFLCIVTLPTIALSVASFVIASEHQHTQCDHNAIVRLSTWLFVNGSVSSGFIIVISLFIISAMLFVDKAFYIATPAIILTLLNGMFMIAWNVIGAISLFKYSMSCKEGYDRPLFIMTCIMLAWHWAKILFYWCGSIPIRFIEW